LSLVLDANSLYVKHPKLYSLKLACNQLYQFIKMFSLLRLTSTVTHLPSVLCRWYPSTHILSLLGGIYTSLDPWLLFPYLPRFSDGFSLSN
jgi:hypothetical protein